jgi:hypothetical protein
MFSDLGWPTGEPANVERLPLELRTKSSEKIGIYPD